MAVWWYFDGFCSFRNFVAINILLITTNSLSLKSLTFNYFPMCSFFQPCRILQFFLCFDHHLKYVINIFRISKTLDITAIKNCNPRSCSGLLNINIVANKIFLSISRLFLHTIESHPPPQKKNCLTSIK